MGGTSVFIAVATDVSLAEDDTDGCVEVGAGVDVPPVAQPVSNTNVGKRMKIQILSFIISFVGMFLRV